MEQHPPSIFIAPNPPPFPAPPRSVDLSPLEFILALIAVITIPALIYTFFFSIKCPPTLFSRSRRRQSSHSDDFNDNDDSNNSNQTESKEVVSDVKFEKETHVKDIGSECPVCLSVFSDGEDIKQLTSCKHSFHASCIDIWLNSHSNCPVCRASVPVVKHPPNGNNTSGSSNHVASSRSRDSDFQQGLPDAANLV